jgi:hypothetical protein
LNIIQNPELLQRLRERLGVRQAHFLPTLAEGVHAVVIAEDLSRRSGSLIQHAHGMVAGQTGDSGTRMSSAMLYNPLNSGIKVQVRRIMVNPEASSGLPVNYSVNLAFFVAGYTAADFPTNGSEFFQDTTYSHAGFPNITLIKYPVAQVLGGRSVFLGVNVVGWKNDPNYPSSMQPRVVEFESFVLTPGSGAVVQSGSTQLTDQLKASFQWSEEPLAQASGG